MLLFLAYHRMDMNAIIKVADFGLAEKIDACKDYFRQDQHSTIKLPLKWMALESINDGVFSEKSDVVSYVEELNHSTV